jgi:hypothetical protein
MTNERMSGLAMIAGSAGVIITLSLHPSGHGLFQPDTFEAAARTMIAVHSVALLSLPIWFLGACGLSKRLDAQASGPWGFCGLVLYAFAIASMMTGVVMDGLVSPGIARQIVNTTGTIGQGWRIVFNYNGLLDQAFVRVFLVASSLAITMWSLAILRNRRLVLAAGAFGLVLGLATVAGQLTGQLDRSPHLFGMVLMGQALWFTIAGVQMCRSRDNHASQAALGEAKAA